MMSEGYPENWKHAVIHFNPDTKSMHFDSFDKKNLEYDGQDKDLDVISAYIAEMRKLLKECRMPVEDAANINKLRGLWATAQDYEKINVRIRQLLEGGGE